MIGIILSVIFGAITGGIARRVLPGAQDIGWPKTIGVGIAANFVVRYTIGIIIGFVTPGIVGVPLTILASIAAGVGIMSLGIQKGYLNPGSNEPRGLQDGTA